MSQPHIHKPGKDFIYVTEKFRQNNRMNPKANDLLCLNASARSSTLAFLSTILISISASFLNLQLILAEENESIEKVYFANGIKIGEVTSSSAIIWTRLTKSQDRISNGPDFINHVANLEKHFPAEAQIPKGYELDQLLGAVPGANGHVRLSWWDPTSPSHILKSEWQETSPTKGHSVKFKISNLKPGTEYHVKFEGRANQKSKKPTQLLGQFKTAPALEDDKSSITFTVATCHDYLRRDDQENGHTIYPAMGMLTPDFFVHAGDIEYFDKINPYATRLDLARFKFTRLYSMPFQRSFHLKTPSYFMKDDHDTLKNDCWPGQKYGELTFQQGLDLFREQFPVPDKTYRTTRWGKHLQIWFVEGRDYRSPNSMPDGPDKSIWGKEQKEWLFSTLNASDASFKILFSPTPIVGPDRIRKKDNYANAGFSYEGNQVRGELSQHKNLIVICGDRHWQYASVDPISGLREFSCGAGTDEHAGGFRMEDRSPMHRYLAIKPGFISGHLDSSPGTSRNPTLSIKFHNTEGKVRYSEIIKLRK